MKLTDLDESAEQQLRTLDQRFIAAAAPRVAHAVDRASRARDSAKQLVKDVDLRDLNALDEKYATRGPLAFFREVPQLLAVLVGIVFIVGALAVAYDKEPRQGAADQTVSTSGSTAPGTPTAPSLVLGPAIGKQTAAYLAFAAKGLTQAATDAPDDTRLAMVSLSAYYRPQLASSILSGYVVKRAWVRVSAAGKLAPSMQVEVSDDVGKQLTDFYARQATGQADIARQFQEYVDTTDDPAFKTDYARYVTLARAESTAFGHDCACAYAFVVSATPTQLLSLRSRPGIRAIEVAGSGVTLSELSFSTLLPEVKAIVPNPAPDVPKPS